MNNEILSERRGPALIVTFSRTETGNRFSIDMANQLFNCLKPLTTDRSIRAVLLRGKGGQFMDGLDMRIYEGDIEKGVEHANQMILPYHSAIRELLAMEKPVIAAVNGKVSGPGMSLMLASDLVIAGRQTEFNCAVTSYAMGPDGGMSFFLARKAGALKAAELLMLNETFGAEEALRLNLINRIVDDEKLEEEALKLVDQLSAGPTRAFGAVKMLIGKAFEQNISAHLGLEHTYWGAGARSFDFREAIKARKDKRPPKYMGA